MKTERFMKLIIGFVVLLIILFAGKKVYKRLNTNNANSQISVRPASILRVKGNKIVDGKNNVVRLRGFQGLGLYPIDFEFYMTAIHDRGIDPYTFDRYAIDLAQYTITDFDIQEIKSTGAAVVRVWFNLNDIQKKPGEYSEEVLDFMEEKINQFGKAGIYVIPVLGCAGQHDFECNDWYEARGLSLWNKKTGLWDQTVKLWGVLAQRFKDNSHIAGYDVINEPKAPNKQALHNYYQDVITEIRKNDPHHIIILEVDVDKETDHQLGGSYSDDNIVASFHFYYPRDFTLNPSIPNLSYPGRYCAISGSNCTPRDWNKETLEKALDTATNLPDLKGKPLYVGEFGADARRDPDGLRWIEDMLTLMNERGMHYTYHNYRHRAFQGYWIVKPEANKTLQGTLQKLRSGNLKYSDLTPKEKQLLSTENSYYQRPGIKTLLKKYFTAED